MTMRRQAAYLVLAALLGAAVWLATTMASSRTDSARAGPALLPVEHFKCYQLEPNPPFNPRPVLLKDQFGSRSADVLQRHELCNPVNKNGEGLKNKRAHLVCYGTVGPDLRIPVQINNQFGNQQLRVREPQRLCVPSQKRIPPDPFRPITSPIDHFQCYRVTAITPFTPPPTKVKLRDQFGLEKVKVRRPIGLCTPTQKNEEPVFNTTTHLVCYEIVDQPVIRDVEIRNQFEQVPLRTVQPNRLCVPSQKQVLPGG